ncbi:MAG: B12-binding domain-containing radical SAM protein [Candidatus Gastranaerophilaceae bacterium]
MSEQYLYNPTPYNKENLNVWISFPGIYNFGMAALGFLTVFEHLDRDENINVERIFVDTKTTKIDIRNLDVFSFSFSFELDFLAIFKILEKFKIPFSSKDRDDSYPLISAGGPVVTANPEPFAEIFDYIEAGDAENKTSLITDTLRANKGKQKQEILKELSKIKGVYVPSLTRFDKKKGMQTLDGNPYTVEKSTDSLSDICVTTPILTENSYFKNTFVIEVARGCTQRCGFCNTAHINAPFRPCSYDIITKKIENALKYTNKIAFLGAAVGAHPQIDKLCEFVMRKKEEYPDLELSVSSLRADGVSDIFAKTLVACGQKHATLALEAGSDRLRKVINKHITNDIFKKTVKKLSENGFKGVKIYGMIGLPTETQEDIQALVDFAKELKNENKGFEISFGFSTFVPKSHTPFQFVEKESTKSLEEKYKFLQKEMHKIGVKIQVSGVKWDYIQALFSRGGRELFDYAVDVYKNGGNPAAFKSVMKDYIKSGKISDFDEIACQKRSFDTTNPWDFIIMPTSKEQLIKNCKHYLTTI